MQHLEKEINKCLSELFQIVSKCCSTLLASSQLHDYLPKDANVEWWYSLHRSLNSDKGDSLTPWYYLEHEVEQLEKIDNEIDQAAQLRSSKQQELKNLRTFNDEIIALQTRRKAIVENKNKAEQAITSFDNENAQLIAEVESEKLEIAENKAIADAYVLFVNKLNSYNNGLPAKLVEDLGEKVVELYNGFNCNDAINEKLASVKLPLNQNQRMEISFQDAPEKFFDALHILSEGHIRCIGLAILVAKNIKEDCPFLIFDDPVNAIDDDHRCAIRKMLFKNALLDNKQIIITCHGEEFFKDIQLMFSKKQVLQSVRSFTFLPRSGEKHIQVASNCSSRHHVIAAVEHFRKNEIRAALSESRQALESLANGKVWSYVNKHGGGSLSLKYSSPTAETILRNLVEQLKDKIQDKGFQDQNKSAVLDPINIILGIDGNSSVWRYLNKGTHEEEDRAEFERGTVLTILESLEKLDEALQDF